MKKFLFSPIFLVLLFIILPIPYDYFLNCGTYAGETSLIAKSINLIQTIGIWLWALLLPIALVLAILDFTKAQTRKDKTMAIIGLVVVIGIFLLVGMILTSLGTARTKARQASVQASMSSMRAEAEKYVDSDGFYGVATDSCYGQNSIFSKMSPLIKAVEGNLMGNDLKCFSTPNSWAVSATIPKSGNKSGVLCPQYPTITSLYCVDSIGFSGPVSQQATGPVCPPGVVLP